MYRFCMTLVLLIAVAVCFAGTTGRITGKVRDINGKPLAYVNITVMLDKKVITGAQTKANGTYTIVNIPPGKYSVRFSLLTFTTNTQKDVVVKADQVTYLNVKLNKANVKLNAVEVSSKDEKIKSPAYSEKPPANLVKPDAGIMMSDKAVMDMPDMAAMSAMPADAAPIHVREMSKISAGSHQTIDGMAVSNPVGRNGEAMDMSLPPQPHHDDWGCRYIHNYMPPPPPPPVQYNSEDYAKIVENIYKYAIAEPLSTFSIDVDTAGYSNVRRLINYGNLPDKNYVRIEELLNYFDYDYPQPKGEHPFSVNTEMGACPWNNKHLLLHIGLQGKDIDYSEAPSSNLVFLIDVSGSMGDSNKLPLVKEAMKLLVKQLRADDRVAIVVYASSTRVFMPSTSGNNKTAILEAIDRLTSGGSTAGGAGITLAYQTAQENMLRSGNNRVILCTDGDFNVGESSDAAMQELITQKRKAGIFLTVLGFGMGNIKDNKMEILADKGNGNYAYIDNLIEAQKVLVKEMGGTLFTIAKDVKLQLEFNPAKVKAYRLVGYENRALKNEDFNNDRIDAGELGAGHTVTALYELIPAGSEESIDGIDPLKYQKVALTDDATKNNELLTIKLRYKKPDGKDSILMTTIVKTQTFDKQQHSENFRFSAAVAGFGLLLRDSRYKGNLNWDKVMELAKGAIGKDPDGYRREFITMCEQAKDLMHYQEQPYKDRED